MIDFQLIFRGLPGCFIVSRPSSDHAILEVSASYLSATGARREELVGRDVREVTRGLRVTSNSVTDENGRVLYVVHRLEDTSRPAGLLESYEAALSNTPDFVYVFDLEHRFTYANEALLRMWGKTKDEALGKRCIELGYEPWHAEMHDREIDHVVSTRRSIRGEVPFSGTDGRRIYDYIFAPVFGPNGAVVAVAGTTRDITDRKNAEQALQAQTQVLAESDRAKDEFLAMLSHELRNPLAPLSHSVHLLRNVGPTAPAQLYERMERQVSYLMRLVDDLLDVSRITRGTLTLRKGRADVATLMRDALETSEPAVRAGGHELHVSLPNEPLWIEGDAVRVVQILANLLDNAAKYTDEHGRISFEARRDEAHVAITVRDNGVGIATTMLPRIFEMYGRGERDNSREAGGLGIGLALSQRLALMHGGTLRAHSDGLGHGAEFTLRLPLAAQQESTTVGEQTADMKLPNRRVLVVDDNADAGDTLAELLTVLGAEVVVARCGAEALEAFATSEPLLVLLDIGMPGMDGYEVARTLRARYPERKTTLVALTGWGQENDKRRAREAGFDHHLVKPAEIASLHALIAGLS